jgi:hypothetical protein
MEIEDFTGNNNNITIDPAKKSEIRARFKANYSVSHDDISMDFADDAHADVTIAINRDAALLKGVKGCGGAAESASEAIAAMEKDIAEHSVVPESTALLVVEEEEATREGDVIVSVEEEAAVAFAVSIQTKFFSSVPPLQQWTYSTRRRLYTCILHKLILSTDINRGQPRF